MISKLYKRERERERERENAAALESSPALAYFMTGHCP